MRTALRLAPSLLILGLLGACAGTAPDPAAMQARQGVPVAVQVPAGHRVALHTVGVGQITYECRAQANAPQGHAWVFAGPEAELRTREGARIGRYFGPPATWAADDGSAITGQQVGVAPGGAGSIPLQLVKAAPATGQGAMSGVSHVQRLATRGGVAPDRPCAMANRGEKAVVQYQADYLFWKAA